MSLLPLIIIATVCYALFDVFAARASKGIDANQSSVIFNGLGALIPLGILAVAKARGAKAVVPTGEGILYSVLAGVAIAAFSVLLIKIFEKGGLSYVVPVIYGGAIVLTALTGWIAFKEQFSALQAVGVMVVVLGIGVIVYAKAQLPA